jgi:Glycine zipper
MIMKFTPKTTTRLAGAILAVAGLGGTAWPSDVAPYRAPVIPAVEQTPGGGPTGAAQENYIHLSHWYNNKYWWKRHAPIIGGAAGGGLIGGLAGGGKGALIGGAAGAGGGALYKHYKDKHHH